MGTVNQFFDKVYLINLKRRADRKFHADLALKAHGIDYELCEALDGAEHVDEALACGLVSGAWGCAWSHLTALLDAREKGYASILIFEDDLSFRPNFTENWEAWSKQIPEDWNLFYLSSNVGVMDTDLRHPYLVRPHVQRCFYALTTAAWACHNTAYDKVIARLSKMDKPVDLMLCEVQKEVKTYAFYPSVIVQSAGFSDVEGVFVDYSGVIT